jgi:Asp-tRNA(Asn)/Glu-tRNA(Gln) amidotransferase A subunit family amidase
MNQANSYHMRTENLEHGMRFRAIVEALPRRAGVATGPLAGVSLALKDMVNLRDRAPGLGLAGPSMTASPQIVPDHDARIVDLLIEAGMDLAAITEMTPLAFEPSGGNLWRGRPLNPRDANYICGGSSSGSAVAVAVGSVHVALGSDTAGSLRIPATCCGVTAWKPTYGVVPAQGTMPLAPSLDVLGFLARSAVELAPVADLFTAGEKAIETVGVANDLIAQSAGATAAAMMGVEAKLTATGMRIDTVALRGLLAACDADVLTLLEGEAARTTAAIAKNRQLDATLAKRLSKGNAVTDDMLSAARARLKAAAAQAEVALFSKADALLLPVMPILVPRVAVCEPADAMFSARTLYQLSAFTRFVNGLGWPAVAMPIGFDDNGLPIGCQLVGPPGSDKALLDVAARFQQTTPWHQGTNTTAQEGSAPP